ncbi:MULTISPECIES: hypothetical protein [Roseateles]|uniref:Uncharacterized protein n=1 Tax=Roseateles flavus TaxID=3149041 RepID=A0ABV0G9V9_9BURK|nr:hypothetical protein [Pelomonas sp. BJYL3]
MQRKDNKRGLDALAPQQAVFATMHSPKFYFAFFWFSHRTGGGEANA